MNDLANYQYYTIMKMLSKKHTDLGNGRERERGGGLGGSHIILRLQG